VRFVRDAPVSALEHLLSPALDAEVKAAGGLIAHFYVVYVRPFEQVHDRCGLVLGGGDEHAFHQLLAGGIAVQDDCIGLKVRRIAGIPGVASAGLFVDKDGPRRDEWTRTLLRQRRKVMTSGYLLTENKLPNH
jgi:hypothetical protein